MVESSLSASLCRVLERQTRQPIGAGFLVSRRHVLTCAHVVADALHIPRDTVATPVDLVELDLPLVEGQAAVKAQVVAWYPAKDAAAFGELEDVAVLALEPDAAIPAGVRSVPLVRVKGDEFFGRFVRMCGFPEGMDTGDWVGGQLQGPIATGWVQLDRELGRRGIAPGFSGTPVWDTQEHGVVGMIVAMQTRAGESSGYMIPAALLAQAWPAVQPQMALPNPYRGLAAFEEQDAPYYMGRDNDAQELLAVVQHNPLVTLIGASGSGKSSLVRAGFVPLLLKTDAWLIVRFRPKADPFKELAQALVSLLYPALDKVERVEKGHELARKFLQRTLTVADVVALLADEHPGKRLLLIADQFEELYTHNLPNEPLHVLLEAFVELVQSGLPCTLLLVLRADFFSHVLTFQPLAAALDRYPKKLLGPMTEEGLRAAIAAPARQCGVELEAGLPERLIDDLRSAPQPLPLLQFTLSELWARRVNASLTHAAYEAIGGVDNALAHYADSVVEQLGRDTERLRWVFVQLVRPGEGMDDTRQVVTHAQIRETDWSLIVRLADARLVVTGRDEATGQETAELVHEALIRHWQPLRQWVNEMRQFRIWQNRVRQDLQEWKDQQRDEGALLRGARLVEAEQQLHTQAEMLSVAEQAYIEASLALRRREELGQRRRRRKVIGGLVLVLVIVFGFAFWANIERSKANAARRTAEEQRQYAEEQRQRAEEQRQRAVARHLAAEGRELLSEGTGTGFLQSGLLAVESLKQAHTVQGSSLWSDVMALLPSRVTTFTNRCWGHVIAFSPNGDRLASAGNLLLDCDDAPRVWDVASKKEILQLTQAGRVNDVAFDPEGKYLGTAGADGTARLWDATTGAERVRLQHEDVVWRLVFSHNGQTVATASDDKTVRLWDTATGKELLRWPYDTYFFFGVVAFSPDDTRLATAGRNEKIAHVWDTITGSEVYRLPHDDCEGCELSSKVVFSPDGRVVATTISDSAHRSFVGLWDALSGKLLAQLQIEDRTRIEDEALAFSADSVYLASANDGNVHIWDVQGREEKNKFTVSQGIKSVSFSPDGTQLVTIDRAIISRGSESITGAAARVWDPFAVPAQQLARLAPMRELTRLLKVDRLVHDRELARLAHDHEVELAVFAPDNTHVATASRDRTLRLWELPQSKKPPGKPPGGLSITIHRRGDILEMVLERDNDAMHVRVWDVRSGTDLARVPLLEEGYPEDVVFTPHVRRIATTSRIEMEQLFGEGKTPQSVRILDATTSKKIVELPHEDRVYHVAFSPDGQRIATICCDSQSTIGRIWDIASGKELWRFRSQAFAFSPDSKSVVASGGDDKTARVWNLETRKEIASLKHEGQVQSVDFSPDGNWLITRDTSKHIIVWESHRWKEIASLKHEGEVQFVDFSPDSNWLITADTSKHVTVWESRRWAVLARLPHDIKVGSPVIIMNGSRLVTIESDRTVQLWNTQNWTKLSRWQRNENITSMDVTLNGTYVMTESVDGTVRVWETLTGDEVFQHQSGFPVGYFFSPNGWLVSVRGEYIMWRRGDLIAEACSRLPRNLTQEEWHRFFGDVPYDEPTCRNLPVLHR